MSIFGLNTVKKQKKYLEIAMLMKLMKNHHLLNTYVLMASIYFFLEFFFLKQNTNCLIVFIYRW